MAKPQPGQDPLPFDPEDTTPRRPLVVLPGGSTEPLPRLRRTRAAKTSTARQPIREGA
jgi:hypothetical protein